MEENAYLIEFLAALFFIVAAIRLLDLSRRTGETPEKLLGAYFGLTGVAYLGWVAPDLTGIESWIAPLDAYAWIAYGVGIVPYLFFTRMVFRPAARWAPPLILACIVSYAAATGVLTLNGELYPGFDNPFYWLQWLGYTIPCVWMASEAFLAHRVATRRLEVGLSDPVVVNRYLLMALFGTFQTAACLADLLATIDRSANQVASAWSDALVGGSELAGIAMLWLAFFPPAFHLAWVRRSAQPAQGKA